MIFIVIFICFLFLILIVSVLLYFLQREKGLRRQSEHRLREVEHKLQELNQRLEEGRARLEGTFSGMVEGVLLTNERGDIVHTNPAFCEMFELKGAAEGRSALEVLASVASDDAIQKVLKTGESVEREIEFQRPRRRVFQVYFSPIRREGNLSGVVSVFHDLTEFRRLEEVRRDFIANLSHELKTPLTAIQGYSETLLDEMGRDPASSVRHLEIIHRHATDLSQLMENLLNLSKIESGREEVRLESVSLKFFVDRILERFLTQARAKNMELVNEVAGGITCQADSGKLNQILSNLVDNAVKYTSEGGKVWVRTSCGPTECCIEVEDNGPGIPAADQKRIFERFYRVDKARTRNSGGAGLGLAIVKHLVDLQGGRIEVESAPGQGSRFLVTLPL